MRTHLRPLLIILPIVILIFYAFKVYTNQSEFASIDNKSTSATLAKELPVESLTDWQGAGFEVKKSLSPIVIIHFWASWCAPCIHEFPDLIKLVKMSGDKIQVVAISEDSAEVEIVSFLKSFPEVKAVKNFNIVWDKNRDYMKMWNVGKLPESYIYGPDRKLAKQISGAVSWTSEDSLAYLKSIEKLKP
jgi:cytochrome c biogenesis protein CcmG, thiol:disulfide interchange protein DsbE